MKQSTMGCYNSLVRKRWWIFWGWKLPFASLLCCSIPKSSEALSSMDWIYCKYLSPSFLMFFFNRLLLDPEKLRTLTCSITLSSRPIMVWAMWKQEGHWWIVFDHFTNMPSLITKSCSHGGSAFILSSMCINGIFSSTLRYTKYTFA